MAGNVHKSEISKVTLPSTFTEEDRGLKRCGSPTLVLASLSDNSRYKNDITRIAVVCDVLTVELERENGDLIAAPGLAVDFPNQANAKGYMIDWRQLTREPSGGGTVLDAGCYKVKITFEIAGVEGSFYHSAYRLKPWTFANAKNTVQVFTVLNDVVRADEINYKDSGFAGSIRFKGSFGYMQPNYETTNLTYTDRTRKKVRIEAMRSYELRTSFVTNCYTTELDEEHLLSANQIWVTEHNPLAHKQYRQFPVILSEDESPSFEYTEGVLAKVVAFFKDKVAVHESKYDGDIEAKVNASFDLPQGTQAEGCLDATYIVQYDNGTIIEQGTIPSGGSVTVDVDDPIVCQDANWQLLNSDGTVLDSGTIASGGSATITAPDATNEIYDTDSNLLYTETIPSGDTLPTTIQDGDIQINNNSTFSILAEGVQNINLLDPEGNTIEVDSVSGDNLNIFLYWFQIAVLLFRNRLIADSAVFETPEDCTSNIIEIGETEYNNASIVITPNGYKDGTLYAIKPNDGSVDAGVVRGSLTTRINENGVVVTEAGLNTPRITWMDGRSLIGVQNEATNMNPTSQDFEWSSRLAAINSFASGGFGDMPYQVMERVETGVVFKQINPTSTSKASIRFYIRNINSVTRFWLRNVGISADVDITIDSAFNVTENTVNNGEYSVVNTGDDGWYKVEIKVNTSVGDRVLFYLDRLSTLGIGGTMELCQHDFQEDWEIAAHIITTGATETRFEDVITPPIPAGTTKIIEIFHDGTTNEITTIPATYEMSKGLIEKVIFE